MLLVGEVLSGFLTVAAFLVITADYIRRFKLGRFKKFVGRFPVESFSFLKLKKASDALTSSYLLSFIYSLFGQLQLFACLDDSIAANSSTVATAQTPDTFS